MPKSSSKAITFQQILPFLKYCVVGALGTTIDVAVLWVLVHFGGLPVLAATSISFVVSVVNNFILNKIWTFRSTSSNYRKLFVKFIIVSAGGLLITNGCMGALVHGLGVWYIHAKLITSVLVLAWNFLANKYWTFRHTHPLSISMEPHAFEYSIIVPAFNEAKRIEKTLRIIDAFRSAQKIDAELIVVDDGSTDGTAALVRELAGQITHLQIVAAQKNEGKGNAVKLGVRASRGRRVLFTDADNSTPIAELLTLRKALDENNSDIAIGSRYLKSSRVQIKQTPFRILIGRIGNFLIQSFIINGIQDSQCGFKLFKGDVARDIFANTRVKRWGFDIEVLAIADLRDYKITEVPVSWYDAPNSRLRPVRDALNTFAELVYIKSNVWCGRYDAE
jgi:dolichyl-phosphate beta-glucosyltransferase